MAISFVSLDTDKYKQFIDNRENFVTRFFEIREKFGKINDKLLSEWEGIAANEYRYMISHITDNITDLETKMKEIIDKSLKEIYEVYEEIDNALYKANSPKMKEVRNEMLKTANDLSNISLGVVGAITGLPGLSGIKIN